MIDPENSRLYTLTHTLLNFYPKTNLCCHSQGAAATRRFGRGWGHRGRFELRVLGHHPAEADADTFDNGEKNGAGYCAVAHRFVASAYGERSAGEEACDDGVPGVLLLPYPFDGAVICVEKTSPDSEVATENGGAGFY